MNPYVVELPRNIQKLHSGSPASCLAFARGEGGLRRLALVLSEPPSDGGASVVACVPLKVLEDWTDKAVDVVAAWEVRWLPIESMPARHWDEARDDLWHAVGAGLLAAATGRFERPDDLPF